MTDPFALAFPDALVEAIARRVLELQAEQTQAPATLLTVDEAAERLRCKPKRVYDLKSQGRIGFVNDGRRVLIPASEIDRYLGA